MSGRTAHPSAPEPTIAPVTLSSLSLSSSDTPSSSSIPSDADGWSPLAMGCATFGYDIYAPPPEGAEALAMPLRTVLLALKYGIRVFDTSPHYHPSEVVLGNCLKALEAEYPRSSYKVITKCGRYSGDGFDYSPANIEKSVRRSLQRLGCGYLDVVYLHDVEFIAPRNELTNVINRPLTALADASVGKALGLDGDAAKIEGEGDETIVKAYEVLIRLREEGLVKEIGISGYPLPVLLRLSRLLASRTGHPITSFLSYSHSNLANNSFATYLPHLTSASSPYPLRILTASPMNMGLLLPSGPPSWHPARVGKGNEGLMATTDEAIALAEKEWEGGIIDLALGFGLRNLRVPAEEGRSEWTVPVVVGVKNVKEVHDAVRAWKEVNGEGQEREGRREMEERVRGVYVNAGWEDVSWPCPGPQE